MKFKNKIVLVTGGSRGIGAETAMQYSKEGATVIITYQSNFEKAKSVESVFNGNGMIIQADFNQKSSIENVFEIVKTHFNHLDILVNNVGIVKSNEFLNLSLEDWNNTFFTNLTSMFLCCQLAIPLMKSGGNIVNIASLRGLPNHGRPPIIDFSASKAGVISFTKTLAKEVSPKIRVNCVSPGVTNTDITKVYSKELIEQFVSNIYLGRLIETTEVANAILFLSSDDASGITGVNLMVDGGQSLSK